MVINNAIVKDVNLAFMKIIYIKLTRLLGYVIRAITQTLIKGQTKSVFFALVFSANAMITLDGADLQIRSNCLLVIFWQ